mgnify:CR=1 FL=1
MATTCHSKQLPKIIAESLYYEREKPHRRRLTQPVAVLLSNNDFLYIPAGYVTDGSTTPRLLWGIIPSYGRHDLATLVHDFIFSDTSYGREFADNEFLYWLISCRVSWIKRTLMFNAVSLYSSIILSLEQSSRNIY